MSNITFKSAVTSFFYLLITLIIYTGLLLLAFIYAGIVLRLPQYFHLVLPSESMASLGLIVDHGNGALFAKVCDHVMKILIIALPFAPFSILGLSMFKKIPIHAVAVIAQILVAILCVLMMLFSFTDLFLLSSVPLSEIDQKCVIILYSYFCISTIMKNECCSLKDGILSLFGLLLTFIICPIILYLALAIGVYVGLVIPFLDYFTYINLLIGSKFETVHYVIKIIGHISNFIFFGGCFYGGLIYCYMVIKKIVPVAISARYQMSAVTLLCLAFFLSLINDKFAMSGALMDKFDLGVLIAGFGLLTIATTFGLTDKFLEE